MSAPHTHPDSPQDPRATGLRRIAVVGGGSAGWMAATYLATATGKQAEIVLVESAAIGIVGVGEATIPPIRKFNRFCGIDEAAFLRETHGTYKVGIEFRGWGEEGEKYLHPFGHVGREFDAVVRLHHFWRYAQLAAQGDHPHWDELYLAHAAVEGRRFGQPTQPPGGPGLRLTSAYHFDAAAYGQHLRAIAEARGVSRIEGTIAGTEADPATGDIAALVLDDGRRVEADLYIDCSGFRSLLLGGEMGEPFESWQEWLPCDRALAVPSARADGDIVPVTRATAHTVGWQWRIPLQNRIGNGHVFASSMSSENEAEARLLSTLDTAALDTPRLIRFEAGRRKRAWVGNVVALGLAAGFLEPLESTSIHLVQSGVERLVELFPSRAMEPALRDRFNTETAREWEQVRDFVIAHYHVTRRGDSAFWRHCASMAIPDSLAATLDAWAGEGVPDIGPGHLFQLGSWAAVLIGQGLQPLRPHALTARITPEAAAQDIARLAAELRQRAAALPGHEAWLRGTGGWAEP